MPQDKFIVIKREDADRYLPNHDQIDLRHILRQISDGKVKDGKPNSNFYAVINTDEPYFEEIKAIMKKYGHWEENSNYKGRFHFGTHDSLGNKEYDPFNSNPYE